MEGGARSYAYKNCYTQGENQYRPLFWFTNSDKKEYEHAFNIKNSKCYETWGFKRTGCVCCPYARELEYELSQVEKFEPLMYKAVNNIFGDSYEYTKQYRDFVTKMKEGEKRVKKEKTTAATY